MQKIKSLLAIVLCLVIGLSLVGCHPKDEVALTVGGKDMSTAMYVCALISADEEGRGIVQSNNEGVDAAKLNYHTSTIDGVKFDKWVKNRALELCRRWAAMELRMEELKLTIDTDTKANAEAMYDFYWNYYGLSAYYAPNGVSLDSYKKYSLMSEKEQTIFEHFYGEEGVSKVADADIDKAFLENYVLVYELNATFMDDTKDKDKKEMTTMFADFKARLEKGEAFADIKAEWDEYLNKDEEKDEDTTTSDTTASDTTASDTTSSDTTSDETASDTTSSETEDETPAPKDADATVVQSEKAGGSDENFAAIHGMKAGEVKTIEKSDGSGLRLIVKLDITADEYYRQAYYTPIAYILKGEDFEKEITDFAKSLEVNENSYAMNRFTSKSLENNAQ